MNNIELFILGLISRNPGELGWYNVERTITRKREFDIGFDELMALIDSLVKNGFLETREGTKTRVYWITEKGKNALATESRKVS